MAGPVAWASVREGVDALRTNPLRTFLSTLGVVIGVAALVSILSLGDGLEAYAREQVAQHTGVQNVTVSPVTTDLVDGVRLPREKWPQLATADADAARREIPGVVAVSLSAHGTTTVVPPQGGRPRAARVTATLAEAVSFHKIKLAEGRFFTAAEAARDEPVAVVSHPLAKALSPAGAGALIGRSVQFRGGMRRVVGVMEPRGREDVLAAYVPLSAAATVLMPREDLRPRTLMLRARRVEDVAQLKASVERWVARRYGNRGADFELGTDLEKSEGVARQFVLFKVFLGSIAAISLIVGGIGIMNVLLASVTERTREIGIRKAVGARRGHIVLQFLSESVAISGSGSFLGLVLGLLTAAGVTAMMRAQLDAEVHAAVSPSTLLVAAGSALFIGICFGVYPALRAARLSPIDAIRHE
jgi:putative ABC transport system permease protein